MPHISVHDQQDLQLRTTSMVYYESSRLGSAPPQRRFGQELDQNERRSQNISPTTRNQAVRMLKSGIIVLDVDDLRGKVGELSDGLSGYGGTKGRAE
jgi:hypothetical protein